MDIATALIQSLKFGLSLWVSKESRKYLDEVLALEQSKYEELKKDKDDRDHGYLDNIDNRLCLIAETVSKFGGAKAQS
jgi:hypothetical protein